MTRIKQDKKILTPAERVELERLEAESDRLLDELFDNPGNRALLDRLNQVDVDYVRIAGDRVLEINTEFYGRK